MRCLDGLAVRRGGPPNRRLAGGAAGHASQHSKHWRAASWEQWEQPHSSLTPPGQHIHPHVLVPSVQRHPARRRGRLPEQHRQRHRLRAVARGQRHPGQRHPGAAGAGAAGWVGGWDVAFCYAASGVPGSLPVCTTGQLRQLSLTCARCPSPPAPTEHHGPDRGPAGAADQPVGPHGHPGPGAGLPGQRHRAAAAAVGVLNTACDPAQVYGSQLQPAIPRRYSRPCCVTHST